MDPIWTWIFQTLIASGVAVGVLVWLGRQWIENQFSKRLEAYKATQAQELEKYKAKVAALFNRITKIHEKEFEVLPVAWSMLQDAIGFVNKIAAPMQTYPDLRFVDQLRFEEFLNNCGWTESDKNKLRCCDPVQRNESIGKYHSYMISIKPTKS